MSKPKTYCGNHGELVAKEVRRVHDGIMGSCEAEVCPLCSVGLNAFRLVRTGPAPKDEAVVALLVRIGFKGFALVFHVAGGTVGREPVAAVVR